MFEEFREIPKEKPKERDEFDELIEEIKREEKFGIKKNTIKEEEEETIEKEELNFVEIDLNLFTIENSTLKILLLKKDEEPYKGHWILPNIHLKDNDTIKENLDNLLYLNLKLDNVYLKQACFLSNINTIVDENTVVLSYIGIIDIVQFNEMINKDIEYSWFPINNLPKIAYQYDIVVNETKKLLKDILIKLKSAKYILPSSFSVSDLQNMYEQLLNEQFDRRNFRKKFIKAGIIEETGDINENTHGRPARLYKFKEDLQDINLF